MANTQSLPPSPAPVSLQLLDLLMGSWRAGVVSTFAELGVADALTPGALGSSQLAVRLGLERDTADRFFRAGAAVGLLRRTGQDALQLTALGRALATDDADSMRNFARWAGSTAERATWAHLPTAVRTGRSPFAAMHGSGVWEFMESNPDTAAVFNSAMTELSKRVIRPVVEAFDFSRFGSVTDVGGGRGALLSAVLQKHSGISGVLFDQPDVVSRAWPELSDAGVSDRVTVKAGSFFDSVPPGSDLYMVSNVFHDWDDARSRHILKNIASAMREGAHLAVVEAVAGLDDTADRAISLMDMDMLVLCEGKQRTVQEFRSLMSEVGIELVGVARAGLQSVIEGKKIS
ncbi:methyltransferase [Streptomyces sp. NPDC005989]|uniref:methyltransferase n=1 Tax=Streptomyces sp. NPDC005989 TaxID=3156727 RepID=UPI0033CC0D6A